VITMADPSLETLLNEMKGNGIGGAIIRVDGVPLCSTIALDDTTSGLVSSVSNVSDAIMKRNGDEQKELEISFGGLILVMVPINRYIFCGLVKSRDEKKTVLDYAQTARPYLK